MSGNRGTRSWCSAWSGATARPSTPCSPGTAAACTARAARSSLRAALADPRLGPEVLRADAVAEAERRALHTMVDAVAEVRAVLDPEQVSLLLATCCPTDPGSDGMRTCAPRSN